MPRAPDELWTHFAPLWTDLRMAAPTFVLAGGYGLFLKHRWLLAANIPTAIGWTDWREPAPRVTKDMDLVVGLDVIASPESQSQVDSILIRHGFNVVPDNARWQFEKKLGHDRKVLVEFHAPIPPRDQSNLRAQHRRVKPKPSLRHTGIHGRENREAAVCLVAPFQFEFDDVLIVVPNPVAWAVMKLVTMRDRLNRSRVPSRPEAIRRFERDQAIKHAQDVCRAVALMTQQEYAINPEVIGRLMSQEAIQDARKIHREFFGNDGGEGCNIVRDRWTTTGLATIQQILSNWFS